MFSRLSISHISVWNTISADSGEYWCSAINAAGIVFTTPTLVLIQGKNIYKCKYIFTDMLKDEGIEVPKSIETWSKFSMHADKGRG